MKRDKGDVSRIVLLHGLQSWNQTIEQKIQAWQNACDFMGLDGEDADTAKLFMDEVCEHFPIGSWEEEQAMVERYLDKYKKN